MQKKIVILILLALMPAFCLFSQNYFIDFSVKPNEPVEKELGTGLLQILFKVTYKQETNQLEVAVENKDPEKTLWLFGQDISFKTFEKKNKSIWAYKEFKVENPVFQSYVKEYYNPLPQHIIYITPENGASLMWKNIDDDFSGVINTLILYTSVADKKGRSDKQKTIRFDRKIVIKFRIDFDTERQGTNADPCKNADLSAYESFLNAKSYELYKIVEEIPLKGDTAVLRETYAQKILQLVNEVKVRQRVEPCTDGTITKALADIDLGVQHGFSRIKNMEASLAPATCGSQIKEINKLISQVEGLYIKIRIANAEGADTTPYRNEYLSIKSRIQEIKTENPLCKDQMQNALNKFNVASEDVASQLK